MEKVGFIGGQDKTEIMMYAGKILTELGKKVIILDTTQKQKTKYIVPAINPTVSYITEFENIDIAVGFNNFEAVSAYLGTGESQLEYEYDYALIDIDNIETINRIGLGITSKIYFATGFDLYSLKRGIEIISDLQSPLKLTKILFAQTFSNEEEEYLDFLALGKKIIWGENIIYFPLENGDGTAIAENQRLGKIKFRNISTDYKEGIMHLASDIVMGRQKEIKNIIKNLE